MSETYISKLTTRLSPEDTIIQEHFKSIRKGNHGSEIRRLLTIGIQKEKEDQEILKKIKEKAMGEG